MITDFIQGAVIGMVFGLFAGFVLGVSLSVWAHRHKAAKPQKMEIRSMSDHEMDAINATIGREWNTPQEDKAWKHL